MESVARKVLKWMAEILLNGGLPPIKGAENMIVSVAIDTVSQK